LIRHAVSALARPVHAFRSAPALSQGLETLPDRHLFATARALERAGFSGERLQRYVRADLPAHGLSIGDFAPAVEQFLGSSAPTTSTYGPTASTCPPLGRAGDL
jgi:hypothetical protein